MPDDECPFCNGNGWIVENVNGLEVAKRCGCIAQRHSESVLPNAEIPDKHALNTFDSFAFPANLDEETAKHLRQTILTVQMYAREYPARSDPRGILIYGANGTGKTHLAVSAFKRILGRGHEGRFIYYQSLLNVVRASYDEPFGAARGETYQLYEDVEVLLLDDVGSNRVTAWVEDTITNLIAQRYYKQRATMVTTNYSPQELDYRIGVRAASRLREMCKPLAMPILPDYRGSKKE